VQADPRPLLPTAVASCLSIARLIAAGRRATAGALEAAAAVVLRFQQRLQLWQPVARQRVIKVRARAADVREVRAARRPRAHLQTTETVQFSRTYCMHALQLAASATTSDRAAGRLRERGCVIVHHDGIMAWCAAVCRVQNACHAGAGGGVLLRADEICGLLLVQSLIVAAWPVLLLLLLRRRRRRQRPASTGVLLLLLLRLEGHAAQV